MISQRDEDRKLIDKLMKEEFGVIIDCEDFARGFVENLRETIFNYKGDIHVFPIYDDVYNKPIQLIHIKRNINVLDMDLVISVYCFTFHAKKSIGNISKETKDKLENICESNTEKDNPYFIPLVAYSANRSLQNGENIEDTLALTIERFYRERQKEELKGYVCKLDISTLATDDETTKAIAQMLQIITDEHLSELYDKDKTFSDEESPHERNEPLSGLLYKNIEALRKCRTHLSNRWRKDEIRGIAKNSNIFLSQNTLLRLIDNIIPKMFRLIALSRLYAEEDYSLRRKNGMRDVIFGVLQPYSMAILSFGVLA